MAPIRGHVRPLGDTAGSHARASNAPGAAPAAPTFAEHWDVHEHAPAPKGTTAVIGGALSSGEIFGAMKAAAVRAADHPPEKPRIAVVLSSKPSDAEAKKLFFEDSLSGPSFEKELSELGFEPVFVPLTIESRARASDLEVAQLIRSSDAVYLAGGDQAKHVRCLLDDEGGDTPVMAAIREVQSRGGLVAGSSAGAAAQGAIQYGEGSVYHYLLEDRVARAPVESGTLRAAEDPDLGSIQLGLGLLGRLGAVVCTHFDERARLGRLLVAMKEVDKVRGGASGTERALGIGLDEDTGLFVRGDVGRVHGKGGVFIVDASKASWGEGPPFSAKGVRVHYLTRGDAFDFASRSVMSKKPCTGRRSGGPEPYRSQDLLGSRETAKMITSLIETGAARTRGTTAEGPPRFTFTFSRDAATVARRDKDGAVAVQGLVLDVSAE